MDPDSDRVVSKIETSDYIYEVVQQGLRKGTPCFSVGDQVKFSWSRGGRRRIKLEYLHPLDTSKKWPHLWIRKRTLKRSESLESVEPKLGGKDAALPWENGRIARIAGFYDCDTGVEAFIELEPTLCCSTPLKRTKPRILFDMHHTALWSRTKR